MAKQKRDRRVSPAGTAIYPHLNTPDTTFDTAGTYSVKLRFTGEAEDTMRNLLDDLYAKAQAQAKEELKEKGKKGKIRPGPEPYSEADDDDAEGGIVVNFKMRASGERKDGSKWTASPKIFDAKGTPCPEARIGGGSTLKIAYEPNLYFVPALGAGVSLRLSAVQVIELVEWGGGSASDFGFDEEDGFEAPDQENAFDPTDEDDDSDADVDGDDDDDDF